MTDDERILDAVKCDIQLAEKLNEELGWANPSAETLMALARLIGDERRWLL